MTDKTPFCQISGLPIESNEEMIMIPVMVEPDAAHSLRVPNGSMTPFSLPIRAVHEGEGRLKDVNSVWMAQIFYQAIYDSFEGFRLISDRADNFSLLDDGGTIEIPDCENMSELTKLINDCLVNENLIMEDPSVDEGNRYTEALYVKSALVDNIKKLNKKSEILRLDDILDDILDTSLVMDNELLSIPVESSSASVQQQSFDMIIDGKVIDTVSAQFHQNVQDGLIDAITACYDRISCTEHAQSFMEELRDALADHQIIQELMVQLERGYDSMKKGVEIEHDPKLHESIIKAVQVEINKLNPTVEQVLAY